MGFNSGFKGLSDGWEGVSISIRIHEIQCSHMKLAQRGFVQPNFITSPNPRVEWEIAVLPDYGWVLVFYLTTLSVTVPVASMVNEFHTSMEHRWSDSAGQSCNIRRNTCPIATMFNTNATRVLVYWRWSMYDCLLLAPVLLRFVSPVFEDRRIYWIWTFVCRYYIGHAACWQHKFLFPRSSSPGSNL